MKALVKSKREPGLWMEDVPIPSIGPNDVLIRVHKSAICGTDMHIWNWDAWSQRTIPVPMHVGHEYVGIIEKIGDEVEGYKVGDRVSGEGHIVCGHCRNCRAGKRHLCPNTQGVGVNRPGSFAEYLSLPAANLFKVPEASATNWPAFLTLTATPPTRPCPLTWSARTCSSPAPGRLASWRRPSPSTWARATW
jgi:threonine 3-dehydrogenase